MSEVCFYSKSDETSNITRYINQFLPSINHQHQLKETNKMYDQTLWVLSNLQKNDTVKSIDINSNENNIHIIESHIDSNSSVSTSQLKHVAQITKIKTRLKSNEHLTSPISGVCILPPDNELNETEKLTRNCYTSKSNPNKDIFSVIRSSKAIKMLSKIPNHIGEYICQLCFSWFPDAFSLAEHPCSCMANLSYPCEICGKVFNCPANLASHQRWHRPRITNHKSTNKNENNSQINKQKIHNRNKSVTTSYNYHVDSLLKQNSTSSESDRQNTLAYSEHINHMFRTSKNYRVSHEEKMNDKMTEEQQLYNEPGVKSIISNGYKVIGMNTNKTVHTPTTSNSVSSFSATCTNKQIDPFSVEALLA